MATATSLAPPGCLQLRFGRGGAAAARLRLRLRPQHRRAIRLRLPTSGRRLHMRADASPAPDSFAGWSDGEGSEGEEKGGFRGLLGAGLAGVFFAAGLTFAVLSMKGKSATGAKPQMEPLARDNAVAIYSDTTSKEDSVEDSEVLLNDNSKNDSGLENVTGTNNDLSFVEISDTSEGRADVKHEMEPPLQTSKQAPDDVNAVGEKAHRDDDLTAPDVIESSVSDVSSSNSLESSQAPIDSSDTLSKDADRSVGSNTLDPSVADDVDIDAFTFDQQGALNPKETLDSEIPLTSPTVLENQHPVETLTSDIVVLESSDVVPIQEISENAAESASPVPEDQGVEQNPELYNKDESSPFRMPNNLEYERAAQMLPDDSNDLPVESGKTGTRVQTLANTVSDLNERQSELEKQLDKSELFESIAPEKSFSPAGIPAPSLLSAALQVPPGKVLVPAAVDPSQGNALAALQVLKVIEPDAQPGDLCTRREYARWLVVASNCLSRNAVSKVYPAMYIENMTELAFDDITPEDPDFPCIQGLAEAGLISSRLSRSDMNISENGQKDDNSFFPESPLSRQDLVSWKMALDKRQLPEVDRNSLYKLSGYIDIDKIDRDAWPALAADLGAGDQSIAALAFGFTRLFQPEKPVTKGQAALALSTGDSAEVVIEELARIEAEKMAEAAVNAHGALVAQVEKDLNAGFERVLIKEREKIETLEKLADEARMELEKLRAEREEEKNALIRGRAAVESEMEVLSKLRSEVEEQLQSVMSNKVEISFEKNRIGKLQKELENENQAIVQLQYELEVERKALSMARAWAEEEAKRAREQVRALEEARYQWERQGIKVVVDGDLQDDASTGVTWANAGKVHPVDQTINRAKSLVEKLKSMAAEMKVKSSSAIRRLIQHIGSFISTLKLRAAEATKHYTEFGAAAISRAKKSAEELRGSAYAFGSTVGDRTKRLVEDCKEGMEKFTHRFKAD